ncbi:MAG: LPS-assembly protein LptD [Bacteroidetes bacterium]|nr:MAG: LPS-assembly protein LptD [Bacteroidota bacterium]
MKNKRRKFRRNYSFTLATLLLVTAITLKGRAINQSSLSFDNSLTAVRDTIPPAKDSTIAKDSSIKSTDSIPDINDTSHKIVKVDSFQVKMSKDSVEAPVNYSAEDSMVLDVGNKKIYLYGKTDIKQKDIELTAPEVSYDQSTSMVKARMKLDTAGKVLGQAKLVQADITTVSDSLEFNFKTLKGLTHSTYFQEAELFNYAEKVKKVDPQTFYAYRGRFTTCNLDTPHFAFRAKKIKYINGKVAVTGPVGVEFEGVPILPVVLPFGMFPLQQGRHSGLLPPQLTVTQDYGLGLEGLGYYKVLNDNMDITFRTDIYSYGSWRVNVTPSYRVRYKYSGSLTLSLQTTHLNFKDDPDYVKSRSFFVTWSHRTDSKAHPGVSFSANVNAGSSSYLRNVPSNSFINQSNNPGYQYSSPVNFTNQLSSSISYQKSWIGKPYNLSVNLNHNQNTNSKLVNLNLPDVNFNINTIYPFQPKEMIGSGKWYQKLGIGYAGNIRNQISFYDTAFSWKQILDTIQWGAQHTVPISLALPQLGPFQVSPGFSYQERWYSQKFYRSWDGTKGKVDTSITKGFYTARDISFSMSVSTAVYGTFQFKNKGYGVQAIRHVMRPTISASYHPDLNSQNFYNIQVDTAGRHQTFSVFDGSLYQAFSGGKTGSIGFGLDNFLEAKVKSKKDTTSDNQLKKVKLIDGFGFNGSYNLLDTSFYKLSTINFYLRSVLLEKINITASTNLDPYKADSAGRRLREYAWQGDGFSLGRITNGSLSISSSFQSKKKKDNKKTEQQGYDNYDNLSQEQMQAQLDYIRMNPAEFVDFNIPWNVNVSYSLSFNKVPRPDYSGFSTIFTSSLQFNGDFSLTQKWKVGANGYYDFRAKNVPSFSMFITRDMHCWQMAINVTPVGLRRSFSISINPKAGLLRDLKVNRTRSFSNQ